MTKAIDVAPLTLEGIVVALRPLALSSLDALCAVGLDAELWRSTMTLIRTREDMETYIRTALAWQEAGTCLPFVTTLNDGTVAGSTRFANIDRANRRAEIGWTWLGRPFQRTAVNTEAKYLMLRHAFEVWGCERVELKTATFNSQSRRAIERIGGTQEGILRHHMLLPDGRWRDSVYFSILADEWPAAKTRLEGMMERKR